MAISSRWFTDTQPGHSQWYIERFRTMAAEGVDLAGEARLADALLAPGSRVLDAGCGPGRVAGELYRRGHRVVGVDVDPALLEAAAVDHPGPTWVHSDLVDLDLAGAGEPEPFDVALLVGNVMPFLAAGTEAEVLRRVRRYVTPDGAVVVGFGFGRGYELETFDADVAAAGLVLEHRFGTWGLRPLTRHSDFAVSILRVPADTAQQHASGGSATTCAPRFRAAPGGTVPLDTSPTAAAAPEDARCPHPRQLQQLPLRHTPGSGSRPCGDTVAPGFGASAAVGEDGGAWCGMS